jgi:hypothetical protein
MSYTYDLSPATSFEDRYSQFIAFGIPKADVDTLRTTIKDMWADAPGGWSYEWSAFARKYLEAGNPLLASFAYGFAIFPCLATDARRKAQQARLAVAPLYRLRRARFRREFVERWPRLQDWFKIPLRERIGRLPGEHQGRVGFPAAYNAHSYLYYLCLTNRLRFDYPFLLALADLCVEDVARPLKIDFGIRTLSVEGVQLGYTRGGLKTSAPWVIHRIALHTGIFHPQGIRVDHINELFDAIRQFRNRPDLGSLVPAHQAHQDFGTTVARAWHAHTQKVCVLLHHRGQNIPLPVKTFRLRPVFHARQPALQAAVDRWLELKQVTWAKSTYEHVEVSLRRDCQTTTGLPRSVPRWDTAAAYSCGKNLP